MFLATGTGQRHDGRFLGAAALRAGGAPTPLAGGCRAIQVGDFTALHVLRGARNGRGPGQGSRARAAPPRRERPPARIAQQCESGGKARRATATVFKVKRFFMQCLPVDNVAPTQCSI